MPPRTLKKFLEQGINSVAGPVIKDLSRRNQEGTNNIKRALGFYVCGHCNHSQAKQFACCPKCGHPRPGLYRSNK